MLRLDFIFSNWIFVWFILYYFKFVPYSPKLILTLAIFGNIFMILILFYNQVSLLSIFEFSLIVSVIKFIPYYIIRNDAIKINDVIFTLLLFILYLIWLSIHKKDFINITTTMMNSLLTDNSSSPVMLFLKKIETYFK